MKLNYKRFHIRKYPQSVFRRYWWIAVLVVSIGGLYYPLIGWFVPAFMILLLFLSVNKGRYWCGNLCPRGSFNDNVVSRVSRYRKIPNFLKNEYFKLSVVAIFFGVFSFRMFGVISDFSGLTLIYKMGFIFATLCLITTLIAIVTGIIYSPRTWCTFCPMGTLQSYIYRFSGKLNRNSGKNER